MPVETAQLGDLWQNKNHRCVLRVSDEKAFINECSRSMKPRALEIKMVLTAEDDWREGAAGDPQVVGIFLCNELLHGQIPQAKVSIGGTGHEHLTARAEGAGYQRGVTNCSSPSQKKNKKIWSIHLDL